MKIKIGQTCDLGSGYNLYTDYYADESGIWGSGTVSI